MVIHQPASLARLDQFFLLLSADGVHGTSGISVLSFALHGRALHHVDTLPRTLQCLQQDFDPRQPAREINPRNHEHGQQGHCLQE